MAQRYGPSWRADRRPDRIAIIPSWNYRCSEASAAAVRPISACLMPMERLSALSAAGDPLERLRALVDFEVLRPELEVALAIVPTAAAEVGALRCGLGVPYPRASDALHALRRQASFLGSPGSCASSLRAAPENVPWTPAISCPASPTLKSSAQARSTAGISMCPGDPNSVRFAVIRVRRLTEGFDGFRALQDARRLQISIAPHPGPPLVRCNSFGALGRNRPPPISTASPTLPTGSFASV